MTNDEIIAVVTALANYRQINMNWHQDIKTTADRLQDFIGKPDLVVTASECPSHPEDERIEEDNEYDL